MLRKPWAARKALSFGFSGSRTPSASTGMGSGASSRRGKGRGAESHGAAERRRSAQLSHTRCPP